MDGQAGATPAATPATAPTAASTAAITTVSARNLGMAILLGRGGQKR